MHRHWSISLLLLGTLAGVASTCAAQARSTADRRLQGSATILAGGTFTGLGSGRVPLATGGRNLTLTAALDLDVYTTHRFTFGAEVRGAFPLRNGYVDGQRNILGGAHMQYSGAADGRRHLQPYADVLAGVGSIEYVNGGFPRGAFIYTRSPSVVYGAGGGLELPIAPSVSLIADAQLLHWNTPVAASGSIYSKQASVGLRYAFGRGQRPRR